MATYHIVSSAVENAADIVTVETFVGTQREALAMANAYNETTQEYTYEVRRGKAPLTEVHGCTVSDMENNLLALFKQATQEERATMDWYGYAYSQCAAIAQQHNVRVETFVAAVAAISPCCQWQNNVPQAINALQSALYGIELKNMGGIGANNVKARRIIADDAPELLSGQKVTQFARNILGDWSKATIDTHALKAACNLGHVKATMAPTKAEFPLVQQAYEQASACVGLAPAAFQAVVWTVFRRLNVNKMYGSSTAGFDV